jgi:hypothetical protein
MPLQIRRGTAAEKDAMIVPLAQGELLWTTNEKKLYIGDGDTLPNALTPVSGFSNEDVQDAAAPLFTHSGHSGISFTYNDSGNQIIATVNLPDYQGVIQADGFQGSLFADDSSLLVDAIEGKINLDGTVKGNIIPSSSQVFDIGSPIARFKDLYLSGTSLYLGNAVLTASGSSVNLPFGSTIGGSPIGIDVGEALQGNLVGSVFGDDSTMLVDGVDNTLFGNTLSTVGLTIDNNFIIATGGTTITVQGNGLFDEPQFRMVLNSTENVTNNLDDIIDDANHVDIYTTKKDISGNSIDFDGGESLGAIIFKGYQSSVDGDVSVVLIGSQVDPTGNPTSSHLPGKFFVATVGEDAIDPANYLTFDCFGQLGVNQENAQATLDVNGFAKLAVLDTAPAAPADGMIAIADGVAVGGWDPAGTGKSVMVVYLAGGWRVAATAP